MCTTAVQNASLPGGAPSPPEYPPAVRGGASCSPGRAVQEPSLERDRVGKEGESHFVGSTQLPSPQDTFAWDNPGCRG